MKLLAITLALLLTFAGFSTLALAESMGGNEGSYIGSESGSEVTPAEQGTENEPDAGVTAPALQKEQPAGEAGTEEPLRPPESPEQEEGD